jgi:hypothetical protein
VKRRAAEVLEIFASKLGSDGESVRDVRPDEGTLELLRPEGWIRLRVLESDLRRLRRSARRVWRPERVSRAEAAARLLTIHLDESVETQEPSASGSWTYVGGLFWNVSPEEAHAQPKRGR